MKKSHPTAYDGSRSYEYSDLIQSSMLKVNSLGDRDQFSEGGTFTKSFLMP
ncbi:hypothetical protein A2U01_0056889, partial [Trifolium medium]|nr:hypothetical protein [Trifolium medium]